MPNLRFFYLHVPILTFPNLFNILLFLFRLFQRWWERVSFKCFWIFSLIFELVCFCRAVIVLFFFGLLETALKFHMFPWLVSYVLVFCFHFISCRAFQFLTCSLHFLFNFFDSKVSLAFVPFLFKLLLFLSFFSSFLTFSLYPSFILAILFKYTFLSSL